MNLIRSLPVLALLAAAPLAAQRPPSSQAARLDSAALRAAVYEGFGAPVRAAAGTQVALQPRWMGSACAAPGCLVAQGSARTAPALAVHLGDGTVHGARATLRVEHGQRHTLAVSLDGSEVMGFSCDGRAIRIQAPGGGAFRWAVYHGQQRVDGGTSTGKAVDVLNPVHAAGPGGGPMQLAVQHRPPAQLAGASDAWCKKYGCLQVSVAHGDHRIVVMPVLARETPFALHDLGVRVSGVPSFALTGVDVGKGGP
jgi:hypothetical protein